MNTMRWVRFIDIADVDLDDLMGLEKKKSFMALGSEDSDKLTKLDM